MKKRIRNALADLMLIPGLSGFEDRVRSYLRQKLISIGVETYSDRLGNLVASFAGNGPVVMLFAHMDQLGFIVRKVEDDGFLLNIDESIITNRDDIIKKLEHSIKKLKKSEKK